MEGGGVINRSFHWLITHLSSADNVILMRILWRPLETKQGCPARSWRSSSVCGGLKLNSGGGGLLGLHIRHFEISIHTTYNIHTTLKQHKPPTQKTTKKSGVIKQVLFTHFTPTLSLSECVYFILMYIGTLKRPLQRDGLVGSPGPITLTEWWRKRKTQR